MAVPMRDASVRSFSEHLRAQSVANRELRAALVNASQRTSALIEARLSGVDTAAAEVRRAQLEVARAAMAQEQARLYQGPIKSSVKRGIDASVQAGADAQARIAQTLAGSMPTREAQRLAQSMAATARANLDAMASRMMFSYPISAQVAKTQALSTGILNRTLNAGLAQGKSARELASDVRRLIHPSTPGGSSYAAMRMARTEINNAYHSSAIRHAAAMPWTEGMKWELSGSHGAPDICDELAEADDHDMGQGVYPMRYVPEKPHPQCLCYTVVIVESFDKFAQKLVDGTYDLDDVA